ncbi:hypothetical protein [Nonomuraea jabiensis]|uniref:Uncharacterized protein n=1 Tax=Nonomuraea jabiensis TaxID=882448 RepID=A0A7W9GEH3_9ACTN|nr:hypothetical protein [Nonomuraea jabiensis]MBB5782327.1 hypothetical protein [Nonomuraea jabiensis]
MPHLEENVRQIRDPLDDQEPVAIIADPADETGELLSAGMVAAPAG